MRVLNLARELGQDIRFGARLLVRSPGFTLAAVVCFAIGIAVTTVLFTNIQSTILRGLPAVRNPGELVRLQASMPYGNYEEFRDASGQFSSLAAFEGPVPFVLAHDSSERERVWGHLATPDYFEVLGVQPLAGRLFGPEERTAGAAAVAVISARLWRRQFGGEASAIGRLIRVNGQPVTLVGVAPEEFLGASPMLAAADLWIPTTAPARIAPELARLHTRVAAFDLIGRLRPGRTIAQAEAALESITRRLERIHNDPGKDRNEPRVRLLPGGRLFPVRDEDLPAALGLPLVLASLVLLMACGNVANMLLARGTARRREIAVRLCAGAGRARLVRQLLTETLLVAAAGGAAGMLLARWFMSFYDSMKPMMPGYVVFDWRFDWQALGASVLLSLLAAGLAGLLPALQAVRPDIASALKDAPPSRRRARRWLSLRNFLVANQVVASMVLLLLTSFIVVGFSRITTLDLGFNPHHLLLLSVDPMRDGYDPVSASDYTDRLLRRLERVPGVTAASIAHSLPVAFTSGESIMSAKVEIAGGPKSLGSLRSDRVGHRFFETAGIPILSGRGFTERDGSGAPVLIVNETMAQQVWPGRNPLGARVDFDETPYQVIGVAGDIRPAMPLQPSLPAVYLPATPADFAAPSLQGVTVLVRVEPGFDAAARLRREIAALDPNVTVFNVRRMEDVANQSLYIARLAVNVYGGIGVFAMILATAGLAGVTAFAVARRRHEIGIRIALGARKQDVYWLVMREAAVMIALGAVIGLALALAAMRALAHIMNAMAEATRTSASDPLLLIGAPALLAGLALVACYFPARQSTRIDPTEALKAE